MNDRFRVILHSPKPKTQTYLISEISFNFKLLNDYYFDKINRLNPFIYWKKAICVNWLTWFNINDAVRFEILLVNCDENFCKKLNCINEKRWVVNIRIYQVILIQQPNGYYFSKLKIGTNKIDLSATIVSIKFKKSSLNFQILPHLWWWKVNL